MNKNEYVYEYCKKFILSKTSPHFAILLKGEWGCGKTFFVKKLIGDSALKLEKKDYVYVSLFGLNSLEQIDGKVFEAMHPILSSPKMKFAGSLLKSAIKLGTNINFDASDDGSHKSSLKIDFGDPSLKGVEKIPAMRKLLIVDDIERLGKNLEIKDVFGYFQDVISESDTKVIFIGNENKIDGSNSISEIDDPKDDIDLIFNQSDEEQKNSDKQDFSYKKIKEKSIGQEFLIKPCVNEAVEFFVEELKMKSPLKEIVSAKALDVMGTAVGCVPDNSLFCITVESYGLYRIIFACFDICIRSAYGVCKLINGEVYCRFGYCCIAEKFACINVSPSVEDIFGSIFNLCGRVNVVIVRMFLCYNIIFLGFKALLDFFFCIFCIFGIGLRLDEDNFVFFLCILSGDNSIMSYDI